MESIAPLRQLTTRATFPMTYLNIFAAGPYDRMMPTLNVLLSAKRLTVTVSDTPAIDAVRRILTRDYDAAMLFLSETPNIAELRELMQRFPDVGFLLVTPQKPARSALARLAKERAAAVVAADEGPVVAVATLYAMLAQRTTSSGSGS